jgi:hypothetical protein
MEIPKGFQLDTDGGYVLKLHKNVFGQKQAGRVWNQYLDNKLQSIGFVPCKWDPCLYVKGNCIYALYTDDSILAGPDEDEIEQIIHQMESPDHAGLVLTVEGELSDFLGVNIERQKDGTFLLTQPHLIDSILEDLRLDRDDVKTKTTPMASSKLLHKHTKSPDFDDHFNYRSVIGKMNYLERCTRPDITYAVHQCARFASCPKREHGAAVKWLGRYLKYTKDKGMIYNPKLDKSFDVYVDANFAGDWNQHDCEDDDYTARSRHGYIIMYAGCPMLWKGVVQQEISLSSCESEFIGLSDAIRQVIIIMELMKELKQLGVPIPTTHPTLHAKVFEDNAAALEIAKVPKMRPRTKTLNVKYHHFRDYVERGEISLHAIGTDDQPADMLTKPLNAVTLFRHVLFVMGWSGKAGPERECEE